MRSPIGMSLSWPRFVRSVEADSTKIVEATLCTPCNHAGVHDDQRPRTSLTVFQAMRIRGDIVGVARSLPFLT